MVYINSQRIQTLFL